MNIVFVEINDQFISFFRKKKKKISSKILHTKTKKQKNNENKILFFFFFIILIRKSKQTYSTLNRINHQSNLQELLKRLVIFFSTIMSKEKERMEMNNVENFFFECVE